MVWTIDGLYDSNIYKVYLRSDETINTEYMYMYGNIALIESDAKTLLNHMEDGKIIGFRKSGVRRIYGEFNSGD